MKDQMLDALRSKYNADYKQAKLTLDIYLKNAVGIGEHPQHFEEMDKLVDAMATAKDNLMTLNEEFLLLARRLFLVLLLSSLLHPKECHLMYH